MKAIIHRAFGAPDEVLALQDADTPQPADGEVLVKVAAVGLAKGDWLISEGLPYVARPSYGIRTPKERVAGLEMAGTVEAVGPGVAHFAAGDRVFGWAKGALAEYAVAAEDGLATMPEGASFEEAAAVPVSGLTALQAVRDSGEVAAGQRVLVIGASGAVGSFAVQIAASLGAEVTGVAGTRNLDLVRSLGATHVVDYTKDDATAEADRYDVIIDIAGNTPLRRLRHALAPKGTLVIVGGSGGKATMGFGRTIRAALLSPFVGQRLRPLISKPNPADLEALGRLIERGDLRPAVGSTYPLERAAEAIGSIGAGRTTAKTVVTVGAAA
ncbi:MAG: NAD(P)-dependent alcohol dehydrogenase [Actinobacteria bacterium]|nr:NAD(P)-dependent alcohol dehydrogenase [Actinomycetota bacterium]